MRKGGVGPAEQESMSKLLAETQEWLGSQGDGCTTEQLQAQQAFLQDEWAKAQTFQDIFGDS